MKLNMHDHTPRRSLSRFQKVMFLLSAVLLYSIPVLLACCLFYYERNILAGILTLVVPIALVAVAAIPFVDMSRSYVEFDGDTVTVVDYYCFLKKEKRFNICQIDSTESLLANSFRMRGRRMGYNFFTVRYIVFRDRNGRYLFKILETAEAKDWLARLQQAQNDLPDRS